jgi:hypothetical protein
MVFVDPGLKNERFRLRFFRFFPAWRRPIFPACRRSDWGDCLS